MDSSVAQVRASSFHVLRDYFAERGESIVPLLRDAGLSEELLDDHIRSVPLARVVGLFEKASMVLGDPCFGLRISEMVKPGGVGLLGKLALSAPNVRYVLRTTVRFMCVYMTKVEIEFREEAGQGIVQWSLPSEITGPRLQYTSFLSSLVIRRVSSAIGGGWHPLRCEFAHREFECPTLAKEIFGSRLKFDRPVNTLVFDHVSLECAMPSADAATFAVYEDLALRWASELGGHQNADVSVTVREHILQILGTGQVGLGRVAQSMGLSSRVLQQRLEKAGTTFEEVLRTTRSELAQQLLKDTDRSLTDIAFDLGYSDPSVFTRAAHRWFDMSPRQYRQLNRPRARLG